MEILSFFIKQYVFENESHRRKVRLTAYLILLYVGIDLFFFIVNLFNEDGEPISLFIGFIVSFACLFLLRYKFLNPAILIHLIRCNFFAFYFSFNDSDPLQTGSYFYFIPSSLGALAIYGYQERWKGIGFTLLSYALFLISIFKPNRFHPSDAHFYLVVSFSMILLISIFIIIFFDRMVTKSERNLLEKNNELIKANKELDRFVYSASHDLRSPLASIAGLIELSQRDPARQAEYLNLMINRVHVMDKFIRDIIDYSRNARLPAVREIVNFNALCNQVIDSVKYQDLSRQPRIELIMVNDLLVFSDPARLKVILSNLVSNAVKYSDLRKDEISIRILATKTDEHFSFSVQDNGVGISEEHLDKIFNMFYRASDKGAGSGLGLYIVKESLDKLNGTVTCQSESGKGSVFTVTIPMS